MKEINLKLPLELRIPFEELVMSVKEFEEKDYCFDLTDEKLSHDVDEYLEQVNDLLAESEEKDYCFDLTDEKLSHDVDEYLEQVNDLLAEPLTELDKLAIIERAKKVHVYEKDYAKIPTGFIEEHIRDYMDDVYGCDYCEFDILGYVDIESEIKQIVEKINNSKCWYIKGNFVGFIDLSEQVEGLINNV